MKGTYQIDVAENFPELFTLPVMLHRHGHHVQHDHRHDSDVEQLVRGQNEEKQLALQLQNQTRS